MHTFIHSQKIHFALYGLFYFLALLIGIFFCYKGKLHGDEGFYLLSANLVSQEQSPYIDFFFNQPPIYPYLSAIIMEKVRFRFLYGRQFSLLLGLIAIILAVRTARLHSHDAALLTTAILCLNPFLLYHFCLVKLFSMTALWISATAYLLMLRNNQINLFIACISAAFACGTRISTAPLLIFVLAYIWHQKGLFDALLGGILMLFCLLAVFGPFAVKAFDEMYYGMITYIVEKDAIPVTRQIFYRIESVFHILKHLEGTVIVAPVVAIGYLTRHMRNGKNEPLHLHINRIFSSNGGILWIIVGAVTLAHLPAKKPDLDVYLTVVIPVLTGVIGITVAKYLDRYLAESKNYFLILVIAVQLIGTIRGFPEWIWKSQGSPVLTLESVAQEVKRLTPPSAQVFSFHQAIPVMANRRVVKGFEMNTIMLDPDTETLQRFPNILSDNELISMLNKKKIGALLITPHSFTHNFPKFKPVPEAVRQPIWDAINRNYHRYSEYPGLGPEGEIAILYLPGKSL